MIKLWGNAKTISHEIYSFIHLTSLSFSWVMGARAHWAEGRKPCTGYLSITGHTQTHRARMSFNISIPNSEQGQFSISNSRDRTSLDCGRKPEHLDETQAVTGGTCKLYTERSLDAAARNWTQALVAVKLQLYSLYHCAAQGLEW